MVEVLDLLRIFKVIVVILGGVIVYLAGRAYLRNRSRSMLFLAIGFALITIGSVLAGILFEFLGYTLLVVVTIETSVMVLGFISIIYSIYGTKS